MDYHIDYLANHPSYTQEVARLKYDQWKHTSPDREYRVWVSEIEDTSRIDQFPLTLLALDGSDLIGFVTLMVIDERDGIRAGVWMITLYVKKDFRNHGVGTSLMNQCIAEARRKGVGVLYLWTEERVLTEYYARNGWKLLHTNQDGEDVMSFTA